MALEAERIVLETGENDVVIGAWPLPNTQAQRFGLVNQRLAKFPLADQQEPRRAAIAQLGE